MRPELLREIDQVRGDVPRVAWIRRELALAVARHRPRRHERGKKWFARLSWPDLAEMLAVEESDIDTLMNQQFATSREGQHPPPSRLNYPPDRRWQWGAIFWTTVNAFDTPS